VVAIRTGDHRHLAAPATERDDTLGFGHVLLDTTAVEGAVYGDGQRFKVIGIQQQIGNGMLVVEFVIGITVENDGYGAVRIRSVRQRNCCQKRQTEK
jgi:hypothetical protein